MEDDVMDRHFTPEPQPGDRVLGRTWSTEAGSWQYEVLRPVPSDLPSVPGCYRDGEERDWAWDGEAWWAAGDYDVSMGEHPPGPYVRLTTHASAWLDAVQHLILAGYPVAAGVLRDATLERVGR